MNFVGICDCGLCIDYILEPNEFGIYAQPRCKKCHKLPVVKGTFHIKSETIVSDPNKIIGIFNEDGTITIGEKEQGK